jgi:pimeloyl-ACP methyl ester carboxylesterase
MKKDNRRLRPGVLGCGPISQAAHLDAIRKTRNADLYAICDVAEDLTARLAAIYRPEVVYNDFAAWLDHLGLGRAVIGGISMGAGVALNVAVRYPSGLPGWCCHARPGWLAPCLGRTWPATPASRSARGWQGRSPGRGSSN